VDDRLAFYLEADAALILQSDSDFRFHSGVPSFVT
jgi:tRNA isopentenyl-2-thiomethyl-A-37 hydroxylase MiaE